MSNTIKINITVTADTDPEKLGEAIAHFVQAITPREEWEEVAQSMKSQVSSQLAQIAESKNLPESTSGDEDDIPF
jgi:hypothetical protein